MKNYTKFTILLLSGFMFLSCNKNTQDPIPVKVNSISIDKTLYLEINETKSLTATITPENAIDKTVSWLSEDQLIATIGADGKVTAIKEGTTNITASAGGVTSNKCLVTVVTKKIPVASVTIDQTANLEIGGVKELTATILPENATDRTTSWLSSNQLVATVDADGKVTALKEGTADITATAGGITSNKCVINVNSVVEYINIPDAKFKQYLLENFDINHDDEISLEEALVITKITLYDEEISSLEGISYFKNLQELNCAKIGLSSLDISNNTKLSILTCPNNNLTSLDVSKNILLQDLWCNSNNILTLDVSKNPKLVGLNCDKNSITTLDVSKCVDLKRLFVNANNLYNIDVSYNPSLEQFNCSDNKLSEIDVKNNTKLWYFECNNNKIAVLDVTKNTQLLEFYCYNNDIYNIDISNCKSLSSFNCERNKISTLNLSNNTLLDRLACSDNQLESIDISKNIALTSIGVENNKLTSINVLTQTALEDLSISHNSISAIDLHNNTVLEEFYCSNNLFTTINVAKNTQLQYLYCDTNPNLTSITLSVGQDIPNFIYDEQQVTINRE